MENIVEPVCPLQVITRSHPGPCSGPRCAWWIPSPDGGGRCAIVALAEVKNDV